MVGPTFNFGYQIKLAREVTDNPEGFYVLTKYAQPQMSHFIPDGYMPHFFFDVNSYEPGKYPSADKKANSKNNKHNKRVINIAGDGSFNMNIQEEHGLHDKAQTQQDLEALHQSRPFRTLKN